MVSTNKSSSSEMNIFNTKCSVRKEGPNTRVCSVDCTGSVSRRAKLLEQGQQGVSLRYILGLLRDDDREVSGTNGSDSNNPSKDCNRISTTKGKMGGPSASGGKKKGDESEGIETPHPHDVLLGRGNFVNNHPGNEHFRSLVRMNKVAYVSTPKNQKPAYARRIVDAIEALDPPGRFLKQNDSTKFWTQVDRRKALDKTRQALREGAPQLVKYLTGDEEEAAAAAAAAASSGGDAEPAGQVISTGVVSSMNGACMPSSGYHQTLDDPAVQNHNHAVHNGAPAALDPALSMSQPPGMGMHASVPTNVHRQSIERETEDSSSPAWDNLMRQVSPTEGGLEDVLSRQQQQLEQQLQQQQLQLQMRIQQQQLEYQQQHQRMREQEQRKLEQQQREEKHQQHVYDRHSPQEKPIIDLEQHEDPEEEEIDEEEEEEYEEDLPLNDARQQMQMTRMMRESSQGTETTEEALARHDEMLLSRRNLLQRTRSLSLEDVTLLKRGNSINRSGLMGSGLGALSSVDMDDPDSGLSQLFTESLGLSQSSDIGGITRKMKRDRSRRSLLDSDSAMSFSTLIDFNESYNPSFRDD